MIAREFNGWIFQSKHADDQFLPGESLLAQPQDIETLKVEIGNFARARDLLLEEFPNLCMGAVECSTNEAVYQQTKFHIKKWEELLENKNRLLSLLTHQLMLYKAIEVITCTCKYVWLELP